MVLTQGKLGHGGGSFDSPFASDVTDPVASAFSFETVASSRSGGARREVLEFGVQRVDPLTAPFRVRPFSADVKIPCVLCFRRGFRSLRFVAGELFALGTGVRDSSAPDEFVSAGHRMQRRLTECSFSFPVLSCSTYLPPKNAVQIPNLSFLIREDDGLLCENKEDAKKGITRYTEAQTPPSSSLSLADILSLNFPVPPSSLSLSLFEPCFLLSRTDRKRRCSVHGHIKDAL